MRSLQSSRNIGFRTFSHCWRAFGPRSKAQARWPTFTAAALTHKRIDEIRLGFLVRPSSDLNQAPRDSAGRPAPPAAGISSNLRICSNLLVFSLWLHRSSLHISATGCNALRKYLVRRASCVDYSVLCWLKGFVELEFGKYHFAGLFHTWFITAPAFWGEPYL